MKGIMRLDDINIPYPNPHTPWNLVFATKMSLEHFSSLHTGLYTISKPTKREE